MGRPVAINGTILNKLEDAFAWGATDAQACRYAEISHQTLYNYCNANPEFFERKTQLKGMVKMRAQMVIDEEMQNDDKSFNQKRVELAKWVLERGLPSEFGSHGQGVPALAAANINMMISNKSGGNRLTAEDMHEFTDDELEDVRAGIKTFDQILVEKRRPMVSSKR